MAREIEIADFSSVLHNRDTDDVYVTFKVVDNDYKDFVMQWATRKTGRLIIRGDKLAIIENNEVKNAAI